MIRTYSPNQHIDQTYQEIQRILKGNDKLTTDQEEVLKKKIRNYQLLTSDLRQKTYEKGQLKSEIIVRRRLPTMDFLKKFLIELKPYYINSQGNQGIFVRQIRKFNPLYHQLFNILIGIDFPIHKLITYSYWDLLVIKLIVGWCIIHGKQVQIRTLFQIVDIVNGDKPWAPPPPPPPRAESLKNKVWSPPPPGLTRVNRTTNLIKLDKN